MSDLKPCPFCGSEAGVMKSGNAGGGSDYMAFCGSDNCPNDEFYDTNEEAIKAWNTRNG